MDALPVNNLPRSTPESQGISSTAVLSFLDDVSQKGLELHSFMLLRNGHVIAEGWWDPYRAELRHMMFSLSKSFTATAIGIAVEEGLLNLNDRVIDFFPSKLPEEIDEHLKELRIKHLLTMSTGHAQDPTMEVVNHPAGDWVKAFLACPLEHEPGTVFVYNTAATFMLSAILQEVTGQKLIDYLKPRLFDPLGIVEPTWDESPAGISQGGTGLNIRTEDIAKFGQLFLDKGRWQGQQIISEAWVEAASSKQIDNFLNKDDPDSDWQQGYGYQMWMCRHNCYRGDGMFGQFCIVVPHKQAVIAITAGEERMHSIMQSIWDHLLPAFGEELPPDEENLDRLRNRLANLSLPSLTGTWDPEAAEGLNGQVYDLEPNELGITSVEFAGKSSEIQITSYSSGNESFGIRSSASGPVEQMSKEGLCHVKALWESPNTLSVLARFIETPFSRTLTFRFMEDEVEIEVRLKPSFGEKKVFTLKGRRGRNRNV